MPTSPCTKACSSTDTLGSMGTRSLIRFRSTTRSWGVIRRVPVDLDDPLPSPASSASAWVEAGVHHPVLWPTCPGVSKSKRVSSDMHAPSMSKASLSLLGLLASTLRRRLHASPRVGHDLGRRHPPSVVEQALRERGGCAGTTFTVAPRRPGILCPRGNGATFPKFCLNALTVFCGSEKYNCEAE